MEPADIADAIEELEPEDRAVVFRVLRREQAAEVFEYLEPDAQEGLIKALGRGQVAAILNDMSPDDRTQLLEELPASVPRGSCSRCCRPRNARSPGSCSATPRTASAG